MKMMNLFDFPEQAKRSAPINRDLKGRFATPVKASIERAENRAKAFKTMCDTLITNNHILSATLRMKNQEIEKYKMILKDEKQGS